MLTMDFLSLFLASLMSHFLLGRKNGFAVLFDVQACRYRKSVYAMKKLYLLAEIKFSRAFSTLPVLKS